MNSLFSLYSATGLTDVTQTADYQAGNAAGWLARNEKQAATNHPLSGRLCLSKSGWLLLSVPNALVRGVFDALTAPGIELPTTGTMNVPNVAGDILNAHISVMTAEEVAKIGPAKINERGHSFGYTLGPVHEIAVKNVDGVSKVWAIQVSAPGLSALRKSYGLSPLPKDQPFHITVAVRRKNVLADNNIGKFDAAAGRGELKAATDLTKLSPKWSDRTHLLAALPQHLTDTQTAINTHGNVDKEMTDLALIANAWLKSQKQKELLAARLKKFQETAVLPPLTLAAAKTAGVYNFEGEVQGVSMRKTLHKILEELKRPGLMYNNAHTGEARAVLPGNKKQQQEVLDLLRQRLADRAAENARITGRPGEAKIKKPLQEGVDYKITPVTTARERMHAVQMTPDDIQNFIRSQGFNRLAAENPEYQKQWLGERYRLQPDSAGNLIGAVPSLAKKQLFKGEPIYAYQTVPGWNDEIKAAADLLPDGQADNVSDSEFPKSKLQEGAEHEHEHTSNDQIAKEIAKDHLSEDPQYYQKQELVENAQPQVLKDLLQAKAHSDARRYAHKAAILRQLMTQAPQEWIIDQPNMRYRGVTHQPTGFKFHTHPTTIPAGVKTANSVYMNQLRNSFVTPGGFQYDHTKPVFENIRNHMFRIKNQGDWILQTQRNHQLYRSALDPAYRQQLALQAFHGTLPQPAYIDQIIERYGGGVIGGK